MRLVDTHTGDFRLVADHLQVPYAILSHTWSPEGEQSYRDVLNIQVSFWKRNTLKTLIFGTRYIMQIFTAKEVATRSSQSCTYRIRRRFLSRLLEWMQRLFAATVTTETSTFRSILSDTRLSKKLREACALCRRHGYRYLWFDACCIDSSCSTEVSQAINLMFLWYKHSAACFAYLENVSHDEDPAAEGSAFRRSRWFTRGWTLQELLAPNVVIFVSKEWQAFCTKGTTIFALKEITGIPVEILQNSKDVDSASVAQRMSWAAMRVTTRVEDEAYCLMGIFGVNMPTAYGEGLYALIRLQEEILKREPDDETIFAWNAAYLLCDREGRPQIPRPEHLRPSPGSGIWPGKISTDRSDDITPLEDSKPLIVESDARDIAAFSPYLFLQGATVVPLTPKEFSRRLGIRLPTPTRTRFSGGMRTCLPLIPFEGRLLNDMPYPDGLPGQRAWYLAVLACEATRFQIKGHLLAFICSLPVSPSQQDPSCEFVSHDSIPRLSGGLQYFAAHPDSPWREKSTMRIVVLTPADIAARRASIRLVEVTISMQPHPPSDAAVNRKTATSVLAQDTVDIPNAAVTYPARDAPTVIQIAPWCETALRAQGFVISETPCLAPEFPHTAPQRGFVLKNVLDKAELVLRYQLLGRVDATQGAAIQVRLQEVMRTFPIGVSTLEPMRFWGAWRTVSEGRPLTTVGCDDGGRTRVLRFTLAHHEVGTYMLGVEPMEWNGGPDPATMFRVDTRL